MKPYLVTTLVLCVSLLPLQTSAVGAAAEVAETRGARGQGLQRRLRRQRRTKYMASHQIDDSAKQQPQQQPQHRKTFVELHNDEPVSAVGTIVGAIISSRRKAARGTRQPTDVEDFEVLFGTPKWAVVAVLDCMAIVLYMVGIKVCMALAKKKQLEYEDQLLQQHLQQQNQEKQQQFLKSGDTWFAASAASEQAAAAATATAGLGSAGSIGTGPGNEVATPRTRRTRFWDSTDFTETNPYTD